MALGEIYTIKTLNTDTSLYQSILLLLIIPPHHSSPTLSLYLISTPPLTPLILTILTSQPILYHPTYPPIYHHILVHPIQPVNYPFLIVLVPTIGLLLTISSDSNLLTSDCSRFQLTVQIRLD